MSEIIIDFELESLDSIPFGKYAGVPLAEVPTYYLEWFLSNVEDRGNGLHEKVEAEYRTRGDSR